MKARSWSQVVEEGRRAVVSKNKGRWIIADLILEVVPFHRPSIYHPKKTINQQIREYAKAIGMSALTLESYRKTAQRWPPETRQPDVNFGFHAMLNYRKDRHTVLAKLATQASERGWPLQGSDVLAALGKTKVPGKIVHVGPHERSVPGTVTPVVQPSAVYAVVERMTVEQIGEHIERCWAIIEEKIRAEDGQLVAAA